MDLMKIFGKTKLAGSLRNLALALSCAAGVLFACPAAAEEPADRVQGVVTLESANPWRVSPSWSKAAIRA